MSALCPNGHSSQATDYCDTCGEPMAAAAPAPSSAPAAVAATPRLCPTCGSTSAPTALFCENCGYDFTTGTPATPLSPPLGAVSSLSLDPPTDPAPAPGAGRSGLDLGLGEASGAVPGSGADPAPSGDGGAAAQADPELGDPDAADPDAGDPEAGEAAGGGDPGAAPVEGAALEPHEEPASTLTPSAVIRRNLSLVPPVGSEPEESPASSATSQARTWVAEVWVDPDWYAEQSPEDPMPSVGAPDVVMLRGSSILVGRPSRSRGIDPQVDCGADTGVSRRHCQLSTDGLRWWVEDLQSANGTYVSPVGDPLPLTPITAGERVEVDEGTRIFVGGWTRVVVREAFPGEA